MALVHTYVGRVDALAHTHVNAPVRLQYSSQSGVPHGHHAHLPDRRDDVLSRIDGERQQAAHYRAMRRCSQLQLHRFAVFAFTRLAVLPFMTSNYTTMGNLLRFEYEFREQAQILFAGVALGMAIFMFASSQEGEYGNSRQALSSESARGTLNWSMCAPTVVQTPTIMCVAHFVHTHVWLFICTCVWPPLLTHVCNPFVHTCECPLRSLMCIPLLFTHVCVSPFVQHVCGPYISSTNTPFQACKIAIYTFILSALVFHERESNAATSSSLKSVTEYVRGLMRTRSRVAFAPFVRGVLIFFSLLFLLPGIIALVLACFQSTMKVRRDPRLSFFMVE